MNEAGSNNIQTVMMVGISVVLTGTSYTDKDTTHIGVEFLKGKWKMFSEIWQNLKDDSIGWRLVTLSQHGKQIVLKLCCNMAHHAVHSSPVRKTNMGIAKQETHSPAASSQSVPKHLKKL